MYDGPPWAYIQKKKELSRVENNFGNFKIAYSEWRKEAEKLVATLEKELGKEHPDLSKVRVTVEDIRKHLQHSIKI